jgi:hypothetical protein
MRLKSLVLLLSLVAGCAVSANDRPGLTAYERSQGWRLLDSASDWRAFGGHKLPANWDVRDGVVTGNAGQAVVSGDEVGDFELQFNWKVGAGGRGAVYFHIDEDEATVERSGAQMQLAGFGPTMGGNGFSAPDRKLTPQFDVWYHSKIVVFGYVVEHWINGERVQTYTIGSSEWRKRVSDSGATFGKEFGRLRMGRVALTGDKVEFRNVKLRAL